MVLERIKEYHDYKKIKVAAFEKAAGMSNSSFRKTLLSGKGIGSDKLEKILSIYPDLSAEWLLRGEGQMERISGSTGAGNNFALIKDQQRTITRLLDRIDELEGKKNSVQNAG